MATTLDITDNITATLRMTASLGTITVDIPSDTNVTPDGIVMTAALGIPVMEVAQDVLIDPLVMTSGLGLITVYVDSGTNVNISGVVATATLGTPEVNVSPDTRLLNITDNVTALLRMTASLGTVTVSTTDISTNVSITGVSATATLGSIAVGISATPSGVSGNKHKHWFWNLRRRY